METTPLQFTVEGMTCGGCVRSVRTVLEALPGVVVERVAVGEPVRVRLGGAARPSDVAAAVARAGYRPVFDAAS